MSGKVHSVFGALVGINILIIVNQSEYIALFVPVYIIGALMPDIDMTKSTLGKLLYPISYPISKIFGHRTITHSFLGLIIFNVLLGVMFDSIVKTQYINSYIIRYTHFHFSVGYLTHLFSDMLTYQGVPLFYPIKKSFNIAKINSKKAPDKTITSIITMLIILTLVFR